MRLLLLTPPLLQFNTPYPATAYLTGFLKTQGIDVVQRDPALLLILKLFSRQGLIEIVQELSQLKDPSPGIALFLENRDRYLNSVAPVVQFLQGKNPSLVDKILDDAFLPEGPRFETLMDLDNATGDPLRDAFLDLSDEEKAKHLASLYIDDIADVIREGIDSRFQLSRYAEKLALSATSFDPVLEAIHSTPTLVDKTLDKIILKILEDVKPEIVGLTIPFPGNVYGGFRIASLIKKHFPAIKTLAGGGFINTELREIRDSRIFDFFDFITLDDGEKPLLGVLNYLKEGNKDSLLRTWVRENGKSTYFSNPRILDIPFKDSATPTYEGLPLDQYLSLCELINPMHRLWSDGRWNKLTLAHGCYWKKCSFCDLSLDYIGRYEPQNIDRLVDQIEALIRETGENGFHFVDEAAPPKLLAQLAERLIERKVNIRWWGNVRFEKYFTSEVANLLARSGCIALTGGLEVASDRLLDLMEKGVTVEQVAKVTHALTQNGILVHAYLMFGFPTQTLQETVDSLERVRQLFLAGCFHSAFWHRFSATAHSPVGKNPEKYGIRLVPPQSTFAYNDIPFEDPTGTDHDALHPGLKKAVYNYMYGVGLQLDVRSWFDFRVPKTLVSPNWIATVFDKGNAQVAVQSLGKGGRSQGASRKPYISDQNSKKYNPHYSSVPKQKSKSSPGKSEPHPSV